jgi:antirestriction protein
MNQKLKPMIYVACLAAYTAGTLHGEWMDAAQDADSLHREIQRILKKSPEPFAEEWAIHDYQGFGDIRIHEYQSLSEVSRLALLLDEHGEAFAAYAAHVDTATEESFLDAHCGHWDSELAYAQELFDELYAHEIPEHLRFYVDYDAFSRDIFLDGHFSVRSSDFGVYVFTDA